jgi:glycosyltransferase involved in cell wall biosynthesis
MDVSIIVTSYNYERYIGECVLSCLSQSDTELNHEVIVVDDGSNDGTMDILSAPELARVKVLTIPNSGIEVASNHGFDRATGRYIVRVDADDRLRPDYLKIMQNFLYLDFDFYYPNYYVIDSNGIVVSMMSLPSFDPEEIRNRGDFLATGTLYSSALVHKLNGYINVKRNSGLENYEFVLRAIGLSCVGLHVSQPLFDYRRHEGNMSQVRQLAIIANGHELMSSLGLGTFRTNENHPYALRVDS